jgi:hypothetical protein
MTRQFVFGLALMFWSCAVISGMIAHNGIANNFDWTGPDDLHGLALLVWLIACFVCGVGGTSMVLGVKR